MALFKITGENLHVFNGEKFIRSIRSLYHYSEVQWRSMELRMNKQFRCKDDDGVVYFWGVCSSYSFDPLDFGEQYGCTTIEYKNGSTGLWEVL